MIDASPLKKTGPILWLLAGLAAMLAGAHSGSAAASDMKEFATPDGAIRFRDISERLYPPHYDGSRKPLRSATYAISWGDANNNDYPDLYLNHHGPKRSPRPNLPNAHLLLDPGAPEANTDYIELSGGDQHGAIFIDINGDGQQDILELMGGRRGNASPDDKSAQNQVILGRSGTFPDVNAADRFNLAYTQGRGRMPTPINLNGKLGLIIANGLRTDGKAPTTLFVRTNAGVFAERSRLFLTPDCKRLFGVTVYCDGRRAADIEGFSQVIIGHMNRDDRIDTFFFQRNKRRENKPKTLILFGKSDGTFVSHRADFSNTYIRDAAVFDSDNDGRTEIWLAGLGTPPGNALYRWCSGSEFERLDRLSDEPLKDETRGVSLVTGDFDNDMDEDVLTYEESEDRAFRFSVWQNNGQGEFERHHFVNKNELGYALNLAVADHDLDGSLDLVFGDGAGTNRKAEGIGGYVFLQGVPNGNNWLQMDLRDPWHLRGLGARVFVKAGNTTMMRGQYGGVYAYTQNFIRLHFGLAKNDTADVRVIWNDGEISEMKNAAANQILKIKHPALK